MDKKLTLAEFLKLLTSNNVPVSKAMAVASKLFKDFNTPARLVQLDDAKLQVLRIEDKVTRKLVLAAVHKAGYSRPSRKLEPTNVSAPQLVGEHSSAVQILITPKKKRKRGDDFNEFLPNSPADEVPVDGSMDFNEVLDEETLKVKSTTINRAPLMTAWATIVAERLGFDREEALSIGSVYTEMNAVAKGVSLGIIDKTRKKELYPIAGEQPYVDLMGKRIPLYQTQSCRWRALVDGSPAIPSTVFSYISRAFRQTTPCILGALRLLAESYSPQELNKVGFSLYADFRPTVDGWGKRGEVRCERILSLRKRAGGETLSTQPSDTRRSDNQELSEEHPLRKARSFLAEYEADLDEDFELDEETLGRLP